MTTNPEFFRNFSQLNETDISWLAALLEGEAYFGADYRRRARLDIQDGYDGPPPTPFIKLETIDKDLMDKVASYVDQTVNPQRRLTSAGKQVYRITITARDKTEVILRRILPYIGGERTRIKINNLLKMCNDHNEWERGGGRTRAAQRANQARNRARIRNEEQDQENT